MLGVAIALGTTLALGGAGIYLGIKTLENYSPGRRKIQKDLKELKKELAPLLAELVPIGAEEFEQLTFNPSSRKRKSGVVKTWQGTFTTVYHEPLVAWVQRRYVSSKENALIYAKTARLEFVYHTKKEVTEAVVNGRLVGTIDRDGALRPARKKKAIAQMDKEEGATFFPITINGRKVGGVTNMAASKQRNPRAFQFLADMGDEEKLLFLVLAFYAMVKMSI